MLKEYEGIYTFTFRIIWRENEKLAMTNRLKTTALALPYYQCEENKAECDSL